MFLVVKDLAIFIKANDKVLLRERKQQGVIARQNQRIIGKAAHKQVSVGEGIGIIDSGTACPYLLGEQQLLLIVDAYQINITNEIILGKLHVFHSHKIKATLVVFDKMTIHHSRVAVTVDGATQQQ